MFDGLGKRQGRSRCEWSSHPRRFKIFTWKWRSFAETPSGLYFQSLPHAARRS